MLNEVKLMGRVTQNIELKTTSNGKFATNFSLAVQRNFKNADGNYETDFLDLTAFGNNAEYLSKYVQKGDLIGITGHLVKRTWKDNEGNNKYATDIILDNVFYKEYKKTEESQQESPFKTSIPVQESDLPF